MSEAFDYRPTILSQYANSPTIMGLIANFAEAVDPAADIDNFFNTVFNVDTAVGFGLDILGRIVGVGRVFPIPTGEFLGFDGTESQPWNQAPFYTGQQVTQNYALSDDAYRPLILAKAMANITDCTIPSLNLILRTMFAGRGKCYVVDGADQTMTYQFEFTLTAVDKTLVETSGVLPHPAWIKVNVVSP